MAYSQRKMLDGDTFGRWHVLEAYPKERLGRKHHTHAWCRCECGQEAAVNRGHLQRGATTQCVTCQQWRWNLPVGHSFGPRAVTAKERDARGVVILTLKCTVCGTTHRENAIPSDQCPRCAMPPPVASAASIARTGVSRQGIHFRLSSGWTLEEATTLPKGTRPPRFLEAAKETP